MTDAAFKAEFSDFKLVKTRSTAQIVLELPIEQADAALKALGGVPKPGVTVWVAVAVMEEESVSESAEKPKRSWDEIPLSEQAGIRCNDPQFQNWLRMMEYTNWIEGETTSVVLRFTEGAIRRECGVKSRSEIRPNTESGNAWLALDEKYRQSQGLIAEQH